MSKAVVPIVVPQGAPIWVYLLVIGILLSGLVIVAGMPIAEAVRRWRK